MESSSATMESEAIHNYYYFSCGHSIPWMWHQDSRKRILIAELQSKQPLQKSSHP